MAAGNNKRSQSKRMRRLFFAALFRQVHILWPIFSGILVVMLGSGFVIGRLEDWGLGDTLYFTFITGLIIGYGDLVPKHAVARILALVIGLSALS